MATAPPTPVGRFASSQKVSRRRLNQGVQVIDDGEEEPLAVSAKAASKGSAAVDALTAGGKKAAGKSSRTGKKSISSRPPATPEGGKRTKGSTGTMTVNQYRQWLKTVNQKKGKK